MFNSLNLLLEEIRQLRELLEAQSASQRELLATVLTVAQTQAEVGLRLTALTERLLAAPETAPPELRDAPDGETFGWAFDQEDLVDKSPFQS